MEQLVVLEYCGGFPVSDLNVWLELCGYGVCQMPHGLVECLCNLPRSVGMKLLGCIVPIDVEPPKSRSGDDAAILGIDHHGCGSQPGGDVLELITNRFVWYHVLEEREYEV